LASIRHRNTQPKTKRIETMTKAEAHRRIDSGTLTWGELKTMLRGEMGAPARRSVVNAGMTHEHAVTVLAAGIDSRPDDDIVAGPNSRKPNLDRLAATNVLRECLA
jgi:hypothetical protein